MTARHAITVLALLTASPALAQGFPDLGYMGATIGAGGLQTSAMNNVIGQSVKPARGPDTVQPTGRAAAPTAYRASPQVAARVRRQFVDHMTGQVGPDGGREIARALESQDPVRAWAGVVGGDGLRPGDAADALAAYWVLNWVIANQGDNNRTQTLAVRDRLRPTMTSNPIYARLDEAQRQELSEVLMLNFLIQHAAYLDALKRNDASTMRRLGDAAVARFRSEMGVDLRRLQLTDHGFVQR